MTKYLFDETDSNGLEIIMKSKSIQIPDFFEQILWTCQCSSGFFFFFRSNEYKPKNSHFFYLNNQNFTQYENNGRKLQNPSHNHNTKSMEENYRTSHMTMNKIQPVFGYQYFMKMYKILRKYKRQRYFDAYISIQYISYHLLASYI